MNWASCDQFLQMGGYGLYVWGSYGVVLALMSAEAWLARQRHRTAVQAARADDNGEATA